MRDLGHGTALGQERQRGTQPQVGAPAVEGHAGVLHEEPRHGPAAHPDGPCVSLQAPPVRGVAEQRVRYGSHAVVTGVGYVKRGDRHGTQQIQHDRLGPQPRVVREILPVQVTDQLRQQPVDPDRRGLGPVQAAPLRVEVETA
ncbi:hypothetical protein SVIO_003260 [Streptomyces violaceusniger]|uniref:Uncharacterized protein n=1 Tax=Streptomyces violaceusniger TaxID=68280 RepID=A0A4D4KV46_STRVO|nr:hypothetical protein SVIO_003260 [Streptomyces violaceusniger]